MLSLWNVYCARCNRHSIVLGCIAYIVYMRPFAVDITPSMVCLSVKGIELIEMLFGKQTHLGSQWCHLASVIE